ncbi:MAG TPA: DUF2203 domain-containing protein [Polyangiaceae bacterium]|nr:DUF2203 domain-containing protein [Polyangiaceae bacterium]
MQPGPYLSLEAVNALVPELSRVVGEQLELRRRIEAMLDDLAEKCGRPRGDVTPRASDTEPVRLAKGAVLAEVERYQAGWGRVESLGGVLKDPRAGLVDFYGHVDGRAVWLCWKYGEPVVDHYHLLDEGFAGRKRIDDARRRSLLN